MATLAELLHEFVSHLPVHDKVKGNLHDKVDAVLPAPPEDEGEKSE